MYSPIARRSARDTAAGRRAGTGWKIGSLAAALALVASLPSQAAVVYSASGTFDKCAGGVCDLNIVINPNVVNAAFHSPPGSWTQDYTLVFTSQSPVTKSDIFFTTGISENAYSATGQYLYGDDTLLPGAGDLEHGQQTGDDIILSYTEHLTTTVSTCIEPGRYPGASTSWIRRTFCMGSMKR